MYVNLCTCMYRLSDVCSGEVVFEQIRHINEYIQESYEPIFCLCMLNTVLQVI